MVECECYFFCPYLYDSARFNRYMVECEYVDKSINLNVINCFNRYMVECEYDLGRKNCKYVWVLIDTWWNVNAEDCHTLILTDTF